MANCKHKYLRFRALLFDACENQDLGNLRCQKSIKTEILYLKIRPKVSIWRFLNENVQSVPNDFAKKC